MKNELKKPSEEGGSQRTNEPASDGPVDLMHEAQEASCGDIDEEAQDACSFKELYEQSLEGIQEGNVTSGEIVQIDNEYLLVDIGYKSEGQIPVGEFVDSRGEVTVKVGDMVEVLLVRKEDKNGHLILSRERAAEVRFWEQAREIYKNKASIKGKITSRIKGGFSVDIGLRAFLPGSQVDLYPVKNPDAFVGAEEEFRIITLDKRRNNIVVSRRAVLEAAREALRAETLERLEQDAVLEGTITNITHYGLFVDLGGIDGLVHVTDISWGRIGHPSEGYRIGERVTVKVLNFDRERERVSLGIKQLAPDPWEEAEKNYPPGTKIRGRVTGFAKFGAFVELEDGLSGLIHLDEFSWTKKVKHPSQFLNSGEEVEVLVLDTDAARQRISLSLKRLEANPWEDIATRFPVGAIIEGKIRSITDFGIFVGIDEGIDGLVHISDLSWTKKEKPPSELYTKGQEIQAVILAIDSERERFSLGIKQLHPDPWDEVAEKYRIGTRVNGRVSHVADFGLFVEIEDGIEGLIHISELPKKEDGNPLAGFNVGDSVEAVVIQVSREHKKVGLSISKSRDDVDMHSYRTYLNNPREATSSLGELLKEKILNRNAQTEGGTQDLE